VKRVLMFSPDIIDARMAGTGLRFWEISHALARRGFAVTLAVPDKTTRISDRVEIAVHGFHHGTCLRLAKAADVVVTQGFALFHVPVLREAPRPMAFDLYAQFVIENLQTFHLAPAEERLQHYQSSASVLHDQLRRGDFFYAGSERLRDYFLGMLVALGRATAAAHAADPTLRQLIDVVQTGLPAVEPRHTRPVLKGVVPGIGPGDTVLLWNGGIWEWFDPLLPIRAMANVVRTRPDLKLFFISRGHPNPRLKAGGLPPVYERAVNLARELGLLDRHVFFNQDWVPYDERANYLLEADIGVSAHLNSVETTLVARTRLLDCFWAELPVLVTGGDTLAEDVVAPAGLGYVVPPGDEPAWTEALLTLAAEPDRRERRRAAFARLKAELTWEEVVEPLARFCERA